MDQDLSLLITGASGFIASHLIDELKRCVIPFVGVDLLHSDSIEHIDLRSKSQIRSFFEKNPIDMVVHLAALAGVRASIHEPDEYIKTNVIGTVNLLEVMKDFDVKKLVFASSSSIYGNHEAIPFKEDLDFSKAISPYAASKQSAEIFTRMYHNLYGIDIHNLRFFTVYGERQRPDLAIHQFLKAVYLGDPITVFGDGNMARDYTYVKDTVQGIIQSINKLQSDSGIYEAYNLGNSYPVTLNELLLSIEKVTGQSIKKVTSQVPLGDVNITYADISKAKKQLGYNPKTNLDDGLSQMWNWIQETYS